MRPVASRGLILVFSLISLAALLSCGSGRGQLKGEVFIVTKGGENLKLGLVEIAIIPEAEINAAIERKKSAIDSNLAQLKADYDKAYAEYNLVHQAYERARQNYDKALKDETDAIYSGGYEQAAKKREYWSNEQMRLLKPDLENDSKQSQAKWNLEHFPTGEFFFNGLPSGIAKAITNSNGEFSVEIPRKGKFALAARAARQVPEEKYYWLIWVSLDGQQSKTVLLSNHNLINSDSSESVVRAKAMSF